MHLYRHQCHKQINEKAQLPTPELPGSGSMGIISAIIRMIKAPQSTIYNIISLCFFSNEIIHEADIKLHL